MVKVIIYILLGSYDVLDDWQLRKIEKSLPATPREVLEKNLMWMVEHEPEDYDYYGPRIRELSLKLGI